MQPSALASTASSTVQTDILNCRNRIEQYISKDCKIATIHVAFKMTRNQTRLPGLSCQCSDPLNHTVTRQPPALKQSTLSLLLYWTHPIEAGVLNQSEFRNFIAMTVNFWLWRNPYSVDLFITRMINSAKIPKSIVTIKASILVMNKCQNYTG